MRAVPDRLLRPLVRSIRSHNPLAVAALAIGFATFAGTLELFHRNVVAPVPYSDPGRLVQVRMSGIIPVFSKWQVEDLRTVSTFESVDAYSLHELTLVVADEPVRVSAGRATGSLFGTLGVVPALGRLLNEADSRPPASPVAVLSYGFWQQGYGGDAGAIGRTVEVLGDTGTPESHRIVGVLPEEIGHPFEGTSIWLPVVLDPAGADFGARSANLNPVARLAVGATTASAQAMVTPRVKGWVDRLPADAFGGSAERRSAYRARRDASVITMADFVSEDSRGLSLALLVFGILVLGVACANVGTVHIARSLRTRRELGIRYQVGAPRRYLVRLVLWRSASLAGLGAVGGVAVLVLASEVILTRVPFEAARQIHILGEGAGLGLLASCLALTAILSLMTGVLTIEARALQTVRGGGTTLRGGVLAQRGLIAASTALTVALSLGAGLMYQTLRNLADRDPGFEVEGLTAVSIAPSFSDRASVGRLWADLTDALRERSDVLEAGAAYGLPLSGHNSRTDIRFADHPTLERDEAQLVGFQIASTGYVETLGLRVLRGRAFGDDDGPGHPLVAVANRAFEREYFGRESAIGRRLVGWGDGEVEIVGVVSDTRHAGLDAEPEPRIYYAAAQFDPRPLTVVARSDAHPSQIVAAVRERLEALDPYAAITGESSYVAILESSVGSRARLADTLGMFASFGLLASALGLFGTVHGWVTRRRREIGIRSALGATPASLARWSARTGAIPLVIGTVAGLFLGILGSQLFTQSLFDVRPWDPSVAAAVILIQLAAACVALARPAMVAASTQVARDLARTD